MRAHEQWYERGKTGEGRIALEGLNLRGGTVASDLCGARLARCDLSRFSRRAGSWEEIELVECVLNRALLRSSTLDRARCERCYFLRCDLRLSHFYGATLIDCDFSSALIGHVSWTGAEVMRCRFRGAHLENNRLSGGTFTACDFRDADLSWTEGPTLGRADGARFIGCDFRNARMDRLRLRDTVFERCGFHGLTGRPILEGPCQIIEPDFSAEFDGTDVRNPDALGWETPVATS